MPVYIVKWVLGLLVENLKNVQTVRISQNKLNIR